MDSTTLSFLFDDDKNEHSNEKLIKKIYHLFFKIVSHTALSNPTRFSLQPPAQKWTYMGYLSNLILLDDERIQNFRILSRKQRMISASFVHVDNFIFQVALVSEELCLLASFPKPCQQRQIE